MGALVALWESEDPISDGDTTRPLATDDPTHRAVNMGVPSLAVITSLPDVLTADQQTDLLTRLDTYVAAERGWLSAVTTLVDLATIEARYEPSGRQWAMRLLAEVQGVAVAELYRTALRPTSLDIRFSLNPCPRKPRAPQDSRTSHRDVPVYVSNGRWGRDRRVKLDRLKLSWFELDFNRIAAS